MPADHGLHNNSPPHLVTIHANLPYLAGLPQTQATLTNEARCLLQHAAEAAGMMIEHVAATHQAVTLIVRASKAMLYEFEKTTPRAVLITHESEQPEGENNACGNAPSNA